MQGPESEAEAVPVISVVIPSYNARGTIERALGTLASQRTSLHFEVIVVDSGSDGTGDLVADRFPEVVLIRCSERRYAGHARNIGIARARGKVLAFTDADCLVPDDWIETIGEIYALLPGSTRTPPAVAGGAIHNGNPEAYLGWGYYFTEFNTWLPGLDQTFVDDVPGCCWTMQRATYDKYGPFIEGTYCSDSAFHWKMAEDGLRPAFFSELWIQHLNLERLSDYVGHEIHHGRCFANVRVKERAMSRGEALTRTALSPVLPFVLFFRALARAVKSGHGHGSKFLFTSPVVALGVSAWSTGEFLGYLTHARRRPTPSSPELLRS